MTDFQAGDKVMWDRKIDGNFYLIPMKFVKRVGTKMAVITSRQDYAGLTHRVNIKFISKADETDANSTGI